MGTHYERSDSRNYSLGGVRLFVNELMDASYTPPRYRGFKDLGCVEEAPMAEAIEYAEHFCARSGTRIKDRKIVRQVAYTITATLIEADVENLRLFLMADAVTNNTSVTPVSVVDEVIQATYGQRSLLSHRGIDTATIVVDSWAGVPYTETTHYTHEDYLGLVGIRPSGVGIADGEYLKVSYDYVPDVCKSFNPLSKILRDCQVKFVLVSDTGNEVIGEFTRCQISPAGDFNWNSNDFTNFQLMIDILDDSVANPSAPYGLVKHFGVGTNL